MLLISHDNDESQLFLKSNKNNNNNNNFQDVPVQEEALLNGETTVEPTTDDGLVNFMHDSQLDRSESQLSPHAPEFQPSSSPDLVDQPEKGKFT